MSDWKPIEIAPKDGTIVMLWLPKPLDTNDALGWCLEKEVNVVTGWWAGYGWESPWLYEGAADSYGNSSALNMNIDPTHWMPLPQPPE